ncbi:MAG TPA: cyclic nucleotide-binding domain-containing protein [Longimicrobiales bacterium]|nr:cyclic nucleotide-binding domain-containing protein [Longimicrobiales bacterium]
MSTRPLFVGPLLHLRTLPALEGLAPAYLTALAQETEEVLLTRGMPLMTRGSLAQELHVIVDGTVTLQRGGNVSTAGPGDVVGFLELLSQEASETDAVVDVDTVALKLDADGLREACERHFAILMSLVSSISRQIVQDPVALRALVQGNGPEGGVPVRGELDRVGRMVALHRSPAFPSASMDALAELAGNLREVRFGVGDPLWRVGDPADGFYLLCDGLVRYTSPAAGWSVDVGPGGVPGLPATLANTRWTVAASAVTDVVALRVDTEPFLDVLEDHFHMAFQFLGRLARCLLGAQEQTDRNG